MTSVPSKPEKIQPFDSDDIQSISNRLKETLSIHLKSSTQFWNTLINNNNEKSDIFVTQNVKIVDSNGKLRSDVASVDDLFSVHHNRHILILGEDGTGKSTLAQKIALEWIDSQCGWTKKFAFLFYFALNSLDSEQTESLFQLVKKSISPKDFAFFHRCLENEGRGLDESLFIFDGLDEFRHHFCDEINDLLIGRRRQRQRQNDNGPTVVVTTKPANQLERFSGANGCTVVLNGYKNSMIQQQLSNYEITSTTVDDYELRHLLKNPFYNALYCVVREDASIRTVNVCSLVERYVKFLGRKYRRTNSLFSELQETELLLLLGQYAQIEFSMLEVGSTVKIEKPNLTQKFVNLAKSVGYIKSDSTENRIIFPHRIIADYMASYYWIKRHTGIQLKDITFLQIVEFSTPSKGLCSGLSLFSCFLSYFNKNYKTTLWNNFTEYVPFLDDYESLSPRPTDTNSLTFPAISSRTMRLILDKLNFSNTQEIGVFNVRFEEGVKYENLTKFPKLYLFNTVFALEPSEFFQTYNNLVWLDLLNCCWESDFKSVESSRSTSASVKEYKPKHKIYLQILRLFSPEGHVAGFLKFVMEECRSMREFQLTDVSEIDTEWVTVLNGNDTLLKTMQIFVLSFKSPLKLIDLFKAISNMPNLNELSLTNCYMTDEEIEILSKYFESGAKKLKRLRLEDDANVGRHDGLMKSVCKLSNLQQLDISDCNLTEQSVQNLQGLFKQSKIQTCSFSNEKVLNKNSPILDYLNSCRTLTEVTFDKCGFSDIELELARNVLNSFSYESKKVLRGANMESVWRFFK